MADGVPEGTYDKVDGPKLENQSIVVKGVTAKGHQVPGHDAGFSYYELGPALFGEDGQLNPAVPVDQVRRYVWHTETKSPSVDRTAEHPYFLGESDSAAYYLAYEPGRETVLGPSLLESLPVRGRPTVVYADRCVLDDEALDRLDLRFRQIPRQIARV